MKPGLVDPNYGGYANERARQFAAHLSKLEPRDRGHRFIATITPISDVESFATLFDQYRTDTLPTVMGVRDHDLTLLPATATLRKGFFFRQEITIEGDSLNNPTIKYARTWQRWKGWQEIPTQ